jgi:GT2 family glycosyltransferase
MSKITSVVIPTKGSLPDEVKDHFRDIYRSKIFYIDNNAGSSYASKINIGINKSLESVSSGILNKVKYSTEKLYDTHWTILQHDDIKIISNNLLKILDDMDDRGADIVGVVGSKRIPPIENGYWWYQDPRLGLDGSGAVEFVKGTHYSMLSYGLYPSQVVALDSVWLAVRTEILFDERLRFDENFDGYHFSDADFCVTARSLGYKLWTSNLHIRHISGGDAGEDFEKYKKQFADKWKSKQGDYFKNSISTRTW